MKALASAIWSESAAATRSVPQHVLPSLQYGYSALEPYIDARTMTLHHDEHHAGYVAKLNELLAPYPELRKKTAVWLLQNPDDIAPIVRQSVMNNAGGHVNHCLFWQSMAPPGGPAVSGELADAIEASFGSLAEFKQRFEAAGVAHFGSGWVWLVAGQNKALNGSTLSIVATPGHENPLQQGLHPLLVNDVWEHAYYLKHENRRPEYLQHWWTITNWSNAMDRFSQFSTDAAAPSEDIFPAGQS
jgi:superoxide dismutase, Fe-Mn family